MNKVVFIYFVGFVVCMFISVYVVMLSVLVDMVIM